MEEKRRTYPEELKRNAFELLGNSGKSSAAVARDLGIASGLLNRWRREEPQESSGKKAFTGQGVPRRDSPAEKRERGTQGGQRDTKRSGHHGLPALGVCGREYPGPQFDVAEPNTVWVSDITYIPTTEGWLYLCVIVDLFDRMAVGWSIRTDMPRPSSLMPLQWRCSKEDLKGLSYPLRSWHSVLLYSFSRCVSCCDALAGKEHEPQGHRWDNACAESFFKTLKRELEEVAGRLTRKQARLAIFGFTRGTASGRLPRYSGKGLN